MKFIALIFILTIFIIPSVNAITTNELRVVLKEVLKIYFENPQNSRLTVTELRDLLISFFETPTGQEVNLNKIGRHSGKLLQEIYDKIKIKEWTIMVFMNGDNNLEEFGIANINDMEQVGSSRDVNVIAQFDRSPEFDTSNGNWNTTKIFYITRDNDTEKINSKELIDLGEVNMGSSKALEDFVFYSMDNYPAKHYALILWNHGGGWIGLSNDNTDNPAGLSIKELSNALRDITNKKNKKLDIVGFDMCLMGMLEVYSQISEFADIGVGSEELEPGTGWDYAGLLKFITENPQSDARTFASQITKTYYDFYRDFDSSITLSAIDLSKISSIINSISKIVPKINSNIDLTWREIARANNKADRYTSVIGRSNIDIFHLFELLIQRNVGTDLYGDLINISNSVNDVIIDNVKDIGHPNAFGLSIYFPRASEDYDQFYDAENTQFISKTGWSDMINKYYIVRKESDKEPPLIKIDYYDIQPEGTYFVINLTGDDILTLFFVVSQYSNTSSIAWLDTPLNIDFTQFEEGQVSFFWDFTVPSLYNGEDTTFVSLKPINRDGNKFIAEGLYTISSTNETFNATLFFEYGELTNVYIDIPYGEELIPSPIEISKDDIFIPYLKAFDLQANEFFTYEGVPIRVSDGLNIQYVQLANLSEEYFLSFRAEDLSENFAIDGIIP